jgi:hypothetical protein
VLSPFAIPTQNRRNSTLVVLVLGLRRRAAAKRCATSKFDASDAAVLSCASRALRCSSAGLARVRVAGACGMPAERREAARPLAEQSTGQPREGGEEYGMERDDVAALSLARGGLGWQAGCSLPPPLCVCVPAESDCGCSRAHRTLEIPEGRARNAAHSGAREWVGSTRVARAVAWRPLCSCYVELLAPVSVGLACCTALAHLTGFLAVHRVEGRR